MMANEESYETGGTRLYTIGDIHDRADLLDKIVDEINADIDKHGSDNCFTIALGDHVDRGPDSRGVIDRLVRNPFPTRYIALKGLGKVTMHLRIIADLNFREFYTYITSRIQKNMSRGLAKFEIEQRIA